VFGADVVVPELERLAQRQLENLLRPRRERDLPARRRVLAAPDDRLDARPHVRGRHAERLERAPGEALLLAQKAEQEVLGADVVVLQVARLGPGEDDDVARPLREALEHRFDGRPRPTRCHAFVTKP
jgi:hypothetical protein